MNEYQGYATVKQVAKRLKITERRVRQLLATDRLKGEKQANGRWLVYWPLIFTIGKRGPITFKM